MRSCRDSLTVFSTASNIDEILKEIAVSRVSERNRADDQRSENAMEERKRLLKENLS
jgi:hypothetical protein